MPFERKPTESAPVLLNRGKAGNADVYRVEEDGAQWVIKTFADKSPAIRATIGRFLVAREARILSELSGLAGIPAGIERLSAHALRYRYVPGKTLGAEKKAGRKLPEGYWLDAEKTLEGMHRRRIVHLDLRRGENWLVSDDGAPYVIDFQSALRIDWMPAALRRRAFLIDYSGLYKLWDANGATPLPPDRRELLDRVNRVRKLWIFEGYAIEKARKRRRKKRSGGA